MKAVTVARPGADRIGRGHPWVFASEVADRGAAGPGEAVVVRDESGRLLGTAHHSSTSQIALRLLSFREEVIDGEFYCGRLTEALEHRQRLVRDSDAYRLVHSEADRLPALVVDRYADYLVVQSLSQGMERDRDLIVTALVDLLSPRGIVLRNDVPRRDKEGLPRETRVVHGEVPDVVEFRMNGLLLCADLLHGQKTGCFLDQRENYRAAARYAWGRALDCFTSTGGFALHLAPVCESVEAVDTSEKALETARRNARANGIDNIEFRQADVFELLAGYATGGRRFGTIILDPPGFAKSKAAVRAALRAYWDINYRALQLLESGGILVTCSCSHHVHEGLLLRTIAAAAVELGKTLRVLERRVQSADHPILLSVPETLYLKCLILQVV